MALWRWGFLVRSQKDVKTVKAIVEAHNKRQDVWDLLTPDYVIRYNGHLFWLLKNEAGERLTTYFIDAYIRRRNPDTMVFWPHLDPPNWRAHGIEVYWYSDAQRQLDLLPELDPIEPHPSVRRSPSEQHSATEIPEGRFRAFDMVNPRIDATKLQGRLLESAPCHVCGKVTPGRCGRCKSAFSCSKEHQKLDWPFHRALCETIVRYKADIELTFEEIKRREGEPYGRISTTGDMLEAFIIPKVHK